MINGRWPEISISELSKIQMTESVDLVVIINHQPTWPPIGPNLVFFTVFSTTIWQLQFVEETEIESSAPSREALPIIYFSSAQYSFSHTFTFALRQLIKAFRWILVSARSIPHRGDCTGLNLHTCANVRCKVIIVIVIVIFNVNVNVNGIVIIIVIAIVVNKCFGLNLHTPLCSCPWQR